MPSMDRTVKADKETPKTLAEVVRERQIEYKKIQAQLAPKLKMKKQKKLKVLHDHHYEERKEEAKNTEQDKVKDLDFWDDRKNLGGIKEYANKLYLKIQRWFISKKKDSIIPHINFKNLNLIIGSDFKTQPKTDRTIIRPKKEIQTEVLRNTFHSSDSTDSAEGKKSIKNFNESCSKVLILNFYLIRVFTVN